MPYFSQTLVILPTHSSTPTPISDCSFLIQAGHSHISSSSTPFIKHFHARQWSNPKVCNVSWMSVQQIVYNPPILQTSFPLKEMAATPSPQARPCRSLESSQIQCQMRAIVWWCGVFSSMRRERRGCTYIIEELYYSSYQSFYFVLIMPLVETIRLDFSYLVFKVVKVLRIYTIVWIVLEESLVEFFLGMIIKLRPFIYENLNRPVPYSFGGLAPIYKNSWQVCPSSPKSIFYLPHFPNRLLIFSFHNSLGTQFVVLYPKALSWSFVSMCLQKPPAKKPTYNKQTQMAASRFIVILAITLLSQMALAKFARDENKIHRQGESLLGNYNKLDLMDPHLQKAMTFVHKELQLGEDTFVINAYRQHVNGFNYKINYEQNGELFQVIVHQPVENPTNFGIVKYSPIDREDL